MPSKPPTPNPALQTPYPLPTHQDDVATCFDYYAGQAEALDGRNGAAPAIDVGMSEFDVRVRREALGVVGLITPWNYPLLMAAVGAGILGWGGVEEEGGGAGQPSMQDGGGGAGSLGWRRERAGLGWAGESRRRKGAVSITCRKNVTIQAQKDGSLGQKGTGGLCCWLPTTVPRSS